jgi:outer membrane lipoprotein carrier protein
MGKTGGMNKTVLIALSLLIMASGAAADLLDDLKDRQSEITSLSAAFTQEKKTRLLSKPLKTSGSFLFRQPDRVRWEYTGDTNMQVIFNGKDLWLWYPDLKEADRLSGLSQYAALMRFDVLSLSKDYIITAKKVRSMTLLTLLPRANGPISRIEMELAEGSPFPRLVRLLDRNREPTIILFRNIMLNPDIPDSSFIFLPGKDVVIRERSLP